jgi:hypothetical protein
MAQELQKMTAQFKIGNGAKVQGELAVSTAGKDNAEKTGKAIAS